MKLLLFAVLCASSSLAQFQYVEMTFEGVGCASCVESLPARIGRVRGVESATVDAQRSIVQVRLAEQNRVRLEQLRDFIEQDGTRATRATVRVSGKLWRRDDQWVFQPSGLSAVYEIEHAAPGSLEAGMCQIHGEITRLRPASGPLVIRATHVQREAR